MTAGRETPLGEEESFRRAIERLREAGWTCEPPTSAEGDVPSALRTASETAIRWVSSFSLLSSSDETVWFLSRDDYSTGAVSTFAWNEWEQLSIQAATTDDEALAVSRFWERHLPILLSVRNGYEYLAVRDDGAVVHGTEPEFEEAVVVFPHFADLLRYIDARPARRDDIVDGLLFDGDSAPDTTPGL
ncbi:hypothetical protein [Microbacterium oxydans]|uniref:hypothetical protein n=1 Tax=Microbacterium oxydans TaxID=82380 RepID=UPI00226B8A1B|nr:hypothetical protein [Microbacterium oxydans]WAA64840.1 hypothetical protein MME74_11345 [Microbacterium oxydans]